MRITGGEWVRRRIGGPPRGADLRPTPDVLREQAFAVLDRRLEGAAFLDLFAGTGVNSLEALSRGAARAVLVEHNPRFLALVRSNLARLGAGGRVEIIVAPAEAAVRQLAQRGERFSLAWCDPPFAAWWLGGEALALARGLGVLTPGAQVVLEHPPRTAVSVDGFRVIRPFRGAVLLCAESGAG